MLNVIIKYKTVVMGLSSSLEGIYVVIYEYLCRSEYQSPQVWPLTKRVEKNFGWTDDVTNNLILDDVTVRVTAPFYPV